MCLYVSMEAVIVAKRVHTQPHEVQRVELVYFSYIILKVPRRRGVGLEGIFAFAKIA